MANERLRTFAWLGYAFGRPLVTVRKVHGRAYHVKVGSGCRVVLMAIHQYHFDVRRLPFV
jgi:hypothetical protein